MHTHVRAHARTHTFVCTAHVRARKVGNLRYSEEQI